ncbi:MAG: QueT transporter family protein [Clostridia bacterium]|nr:QueT transporter family protein [Clostridia bacterium]
MKNLFTARRLCRAGVIAALYVALTYAFGALSFQGFFQIRPAEALCILPLFFSEAVPALFVGCMISNITSPFWIYDVFLGSLATLLAALTTYMVGVFLKKTPLKILLGGLSPVLFNAFMIPVIIVFLCGGVDYGTKIASYFIYASSLALTEAVWVYALGTPLFFFLQRMRRKNIKFFL